MAGLQLGGQDWDVSVTKQTKDVKPSPTGEPGVCIRELQVRLIP